MIDELKNNTLFQKIFQSSMEGILIVDNNSFIIKANPAIEQMFGLNKEEVIHKKVEDLIPQKFNEFKKEKNQIIEYSHVVKNTLKHLESRIVETDEGSFLIIIRDVTKSKNVEKNIIENEERKRLALEVGELGSWEWNLVTNRIVRDEYQNFLFGLKAKDDADTYQSFLDKIHPEDRENVKLEVSRAIKNASSYTLDYRIVHPDSSIHWLHEKGKIFKNSKGKSTRVIGVTHDISKQKNTEKKIKEDEEELRNYALKLEKKVKERTKELTTTVQKLVESNLSLEDQILITKEAEIEVLTSKLLLDNIAQNFPNGVITVVNDNCSIDYIEGEGLEEMGIKGLVTKGTIIDEIKSFSEERKLRFKEDVRKTVHGEHLSFEIEFNNNSYLVNTTPLLNKEQKIKQALFVYSNISEQKQVELKIKNSLEKEQELSKLKSRFISMASHEFRTPLSAILSSAILIKKLNAQGKEEKISNHVSKIRSNVKNLVVILNDFLSLSKLQEGKVIAQPVSFNIVDFSKSLCEEIESIKKNGQTITFQPQHQNIEVFLDPKLLKHIIYNLLSNALKYSEEKKNITFKIVQTNQKLLLEIKDQGIGIPVEDQNNMFQRFYRASNASNIEGTGLGLNIVKQYTELMGGIINFKSQLNKGATFYIEFPLNEKK
ncbi:sensor histidine kinase [Polaribacter sp. Hel1_85]|uniref:PAS domain-containing sensor histidine kinase n=1 Tax=Polaribacter sp. Hel1_85 TaxID=1250005 RepID=UPI00052DDAA0|nr:HAMP domain-containing sensor histidine kinase [Polaribacter sp. Hel1_85]KGL64294.1 two-component system-sensor histidine kinase [Polaribacter sp. Hel1_85]